MTAEESRAFIAQYRKTHPMPVFAASVCKCPCCSKQGCNCLRVYPCATCLKCLQHCLCKAGPQQPDLFEGFISVDEADREPSGKGYGT